MYIYGAIWKSIVFIHSGYFCSASSSPLELRDAPDYSIDTVLELTCQSATGNFELMTCPRSLHGDYSGIWTCNPPYARHRTYHWVTTPHNSCVSIKWAYSVCRIFQKSVTSTSTHKHHHKEILLAMQYKFNWVNTFLDKARNSNQSNNGTKRGLY